MDLYLHGFTGHGDMCLYAGQIRILWQMPGGTVCLLLICFEVCFNA